MIDVARARAETPGATERIHLNNAGAALMSRAVLDAQISHLELESHLGGYEAERLEEPRFLEIYGSIADLIGASPQEIAIVDNATAAWNLAFQSIPFEKGDTILTAEAEYATNFIMYLKTVQDLGVVVRVVPSDETGQLDVAELERLIDPSTRLISISHIPTNGGLVNPAEAIGAVAREAGVPFLLDACQSVGQLVVDVDNLQCDFLAATGRKFLRGPRGTGFLYVRQEMLDRFEPPVIDLRGATWVEPDRYEVRPDARRYETWEFNHAGVLGLGVAVDEARARGMADIEDRVTFLGASLRAKLHDNGFPTYDVGSRLCAIVTTEVPGVDSAQVRDSLFDRGINVSVTGPDSTLLDAQRRGLPDLLRLSPHYYNTEEELDETVTALVDLRP